MGTLHCETKFRLYNNLITLRKNFHVYKFVTMHVIVYPDYKSVVSLVQKFTSGR